ncbi:unnamed protein product [Amoebophrya sp. A25]|nr:unnamed protein product [Amoebophrya sp. A25]|eukprot:GSA25T00020143001.1
MPRRLRVRRPFPHARRSYNYKNYYSICVIAGPQRPSSYPLQRHHVALSYILKNSVVVVFVRTETRCITIML